MRYSMLVMRLPRSLRDNSGTDALTVLTYPGRFAEIVANASKGHLYFCKFKIYFKSGGEIQDCLCHFVW